MPTQLTPEDRDQMIADLVRRVDVLERTARVGLNRVRFAWTTHASGAAPQSTMDVWEAGPAGSTWEDDQGNTGSGYPRVTLDLGRRVLFLAQSLYRDVSTDAGFKSSLFRFGPGLDGANPDAWPLNPTLMRGGASHGPTTEGTQRLSFVGGRDDITPGSHEIKFWGYWGTSSGPGGATLPSLHEAFLAVVPIDL